MSRQKKDKPPNETTPDNRQLDQQAHSDQFIALQRQIDRCEQSRNELIQSRNYAILTAVLAALAVFYLLLFNPPKDNTAEQQVLIARQLAAHKKQLTSKQCASACAQSTTDDPGKMISRINQTLNGKAATSTGISDIRISSVLNQANTPAADINRIKRHDKLEISRMLHLWAVAWELKNLSTYFAYYAENFDPQNKTGDLSAWKAKRSFYINKPDQIKVTIQDITIQHLDNDTASVSFNQHYQTPDYADKTHKLLDLVRQDDKWLILRENSITTSVDFKGQL